jgi:hypothetical protein
LAHRLNLGRRLLRLRDRLVPLLRLAHMNDRGVPGLVVALGGAWVGVPHGVLEIAEWPPGIEVQGREWMPHHAWSEVAGQVGWQASPGGETAHGVPHVGGG